MDNKYLFRVWCKDKNEYEKHNVLLASDGTLSHFDGRRFMQLREENHVIEFCTGSTAPKSFRGESSGDRLMFDGDIVYIPIWDYKAEVYQTKGAWLLKFSDSDEYLYDIAHMCEIVGTIHNTIFSEDKTHE